MQSDRTLNVGTAPVSPHAAGEAGEQQRAAPSRASLRRIGLLILTGVSGLAAAGAVPRILRERAATSAPDVEAPLPPRVLIVPARRAPASQMIALPGTVQPLQETAIYARTSGYVRKWYVDIGAEVKKGQILVDLDLPDVDEELRQARASALQAEASVTQAQSQLDFARVTNDRYTALIPSGVVSRQETQQYSSAFDVQRAALRAAEAAKGNANANVRRVEDLRSFGRITTPFDGVVTLRSAELGQLVVAGTGQGQPLFKVAETDIVRVFLHVPQLYAAGVTVDMSAPVTIRETPGREFPGKVARTANELDRATRSLLVEVDVANADRALVSGMYAQVSLELKRQHEPVTVPATAAIFDASGVRVARIQDGVVRWKTVALEADLGDRLAIATGLAEGDTVAVTASERLTEGMHVRAQTGP